MPDYHKTHQNLDNVEVIAHRWKNRLGRNKGRGLTRHEIQIIGKKKGQGNRIGRNGFRDWAFCQMEKDLINAGIKSQRKRHKLIGEALGYEYETVRYAIRAYKKRIDGKYLHRFD